MPVLIVQYCLIVFFIGNLIASPIDQITVNALNSQISASELNDTDNDEDPSDGNISQISASFSNQRSFACPLVKTLLLTGTGVGDISPEDIDIVAAMGDALASGRGLWPGSDLEFRGAAFPIGGDEAIDGLVTLPNTLLKFKDQLFGMSHGMGSRDRLPDYQFNTAQAGARTQDLPDQATELIRRIHTLFTHDQLKVKWAFVTIAIGTESVCDHCGTPSFNALRHTLNILRKGLPRALIVLLGPVKVGGSSDKTIAVLKSRCPCFESVNKIRSLYAQWVTTFTDLQDHFNSLPPLPDVDLDRYANEAKCTLQSLAELEKKNALDRAAALDRGVNDTDIGEEAVVDHHTRIRRYLLPVVAIVIICAFISVTSFGTFFYRRELKNIKDRYEQNPEDEKTIDGEQPESQGRNAG